ncbi:MAG: response regulator transcription factor [Lachnospiraceae bacterium]|nr:response regulator transcription factor [Lachnospiraceae bacterium]
MPQKLTVLIVEDERNICDFISTSLTMQDYRVLTAYTGKAGLSLIASQCPDVVLLDLGLPDLDGLELIRQVRSWSAVPILVISARTGERDKVAALDLGADDYITKPFGSSELMARIRTAIRHSHRLNGADGIQQPFSYDGLTIDFDRRQVTLHGEPIHLTQIEYKIVVFLAENSGRVVTYDAIISHVWGPFASTDNNRILRVNMANIRRKLEENPAEPRYILTEIGVGYRMREGCS